VTQRPSDPGIQRPGDPVDPVTLFYIMNSKNVDLCVEMCESSFLLLIDVTKKYSQAKEFLIIYR